MTIHQASTHPDDVDDPLIFFKQDNGNSSTVLNVSPTERGLTYSIVGPAARDLQGPIKLPLYSKSAPLLYHGEKNILLTLVEDIIDVLTWLPANETDTCKSDAMWSLNWPQQQYHHRSPSISLCTASCVEGFSSKF